MISTRKFTNNGIWFLLVFFLNSSSAAPQSRDDNEPNVVVFSGVTNIEFSRSRRLALFQFSNSFAVVISARLPTTAEELKAIRTTEGQAIGFLPSESVAYIHNGTIRVFNPATAETTLAISAKEIERSGLESFERRNLAIVSNNVFLTGDGSWDWGGSMGNIYSFDLRKQKVIKRTQIRGMFYPQISSSGKYMLFEYGAEDNNNAYIYDIGKNTNHSLYEYFNFKKEFPKIEEFSEAPVVWLRNTDRFLVMVSEGGGSDEEDGGFLVLVDVAAKSIVWKSLLSQLFFPTYFHQIDDDLALFSNDSGVFRVELATGKVTGPTLKGESASVSPDGKLVAYYESDRLMVSKADGKDPKPMLELKGSNKVGTSYKAMGMRSPIWTPDSKSLFVLTAYGASWVNF